MTNEEIRSILFILRDAVVEIAEILEGDTDYAAYQYRLHTLQYQLKAIEI